MATILEQPAVEMPPEQPAVELPPEQPAEVAPPTAPPAAPPAVAPERPPVGPDGSPVALAEWADCPPAIRGLVADAKKIWMRSGENIHAIMSAIKLPADATSGPVPKAGDMFLVPYSRRFDLKELDGHTWHMRRSMHLKGEPGLWGPGRWDRGFGTAVRATGPLSPDTHPCLTAVNNEKAIEVIYNTNVTGTLQRRAYRYFDLSSPLGDLQLLHYRANVAGGRKRSRGDEDSAREGHSQPAAQVPRLLPAQPRIQTNRQPGEYREYREFVVRCNAVGSFVVRAQCASEAEAETVHDLLDACVDALIPAGWQPRLRVDRFGGQLEAIAPDLATPEVLLHVLKDSLLGALPGAPGGDVAFVCLVADGDRPALLLPAMRAAERYMEWASVLSGDLAAWRDWELHAGGAAAAAGGEGQLKLVLPPQLQGRERMQLVRALSAVLE
jgi:hypothetical protein